MCPRLRLLGQVAAAAGRPVDDGVDNGVDN